MDASENMFTVIWMSLNTLTSDDKINKTKHCELTSLQPKQKIVYYKICEVLWI